MRKLTSAALLLALLSTVAQAQGWEVPKPSPGLMPNPNMGKPLFENKCASCHGADLNGSDKGPPMLNKIYEPSHHADVSFQIAARMGVRSHHWRFGDMPPVADVTPDEVAHITAYIRMHQRKAGIH